MATLADEQAARFAADKKARDGQGFFDRMRRAVTTQPVAVTAKAEPVKAPASTRELLQNRGKSIDAAVDKAVGMKRGGKVKGKRK